MLLHIAKLFYMEYNYDLNESKAKAAAVFKTRTAPTHLRRSVGPISVGHVRCPIPIAQSVSERQPTASQRVHSACRRIHLHNRCPHQNISRSRDVHPYFSPESCAHVAVSSQSQHQSKWMRQRTTSSLNPALAWRDHRTVCNKGNTTARHDCKTWSNHSRTS
jgi:hypothetical protein